MAGGLAGCLAGFVWLVWLAGWLTLVGLVWTSCTTLSPLTSSMIDAKYDGIVNDLQKCPHDVI